ncbi:TPA: MBL fold metallo-hydrolase RNA specificity domain-containing protein [Photobacterium damselae]
MDIIHHGAKDGVTGSCHQLQIEQDGFTSSLLIDCGLFQGRESRPNLDIEFDISTVEALLITHCHIDHIGRIPWLLAKGFTGPIFTTEASAALLPLMLEDSLKLQLGLNKKQCQKFIERIEKQIKPVPYHCWIQQRLASFDSVSIRFSPAGHILGSAFIEIKLPSRQVVVFSGDLGPTNTPLLVDPQSPYQADILVLESTYGYKSTHGVKERALHLFDIIHRSLLDGGVILIPAFSVGRTQELLFDIENIIADTIYRCGLKEPIPINWQSLPVILDSPLAQKITDQYQQFQHLWAKEAKDKVYHGRHPLSFSQCITIEDHSDHLALINRLQKSGEPAIVVAASGMCTGGRIMNYLKALLPDSRTDVIFAGYQAEGTLGRELLDGALEISIDKKSIEVNACIHQMSGYSAHAAQQDLLAFVDGIEHKPKRIHVIHGEEAAQRALADKLMTLYPEIEVVCGVDMGGIREKKENKGRAGRKG